MGNAPINKQQVGFNKFKNFNNVFSDFKINENKQNFKNNFRLAFNNRKFNDKKKESEKKESSSEEEEEKEEEKEEKEESEIDEESESFPDYEYEKSEEDEDEDSDDDDIEEKIEETEKEDEKTETEEEEEEDEEDKEEEEKEEEEEEEEKEEEEEEEEEEEDKDESSRISIESSFSNIKKNKNKLGYNILKNYDKNEAIDRLFIELYKKGLAYKMINIYDRDRKIIGKRILKKYNKYPNKKWIKVYHGTKYNCLISIIKNGLKKPGEIYDNGNDEKVKPRKGHINFGKTINNVKNWAKAIFVSPSIFYSSCRCYSERIESNNNTWRIVIEVKIKPKSFESYNSTIPKYHFLLGEPKKIEYRIVDKNDIKVYSVLFVEDNFISRAKNYKEGSIYNFIND